MKKKLYLLISFYLTAMISNGKKTLCNSRLMLVFQYFFKLGIGVHKVSFFPRFHLYIKNFPETIHIDLNRR